jgi:hypothetical protein
VCVCVCVCVCAKSALIIAFDKANRAHQPIKPISPNHNSESTTHPDEPTCFIIFRAAGLVPMTGLNVGRSAVDSAFFFSAVCLP